MDVIQNQQIVPEKKKYVLNAHLGYINSLPMYSKETQNIINKTLDIIEQHLYPIFGKYALHNLIIHDHHISKFTTNIFTHDGINSLLNLEFMSPIQKYLANNIVYIGQHVDRVAHDGTTTAMLFATLLFKKLYNLLADYHDSSSQEEFKVIATNISKALQKIMDIFIDDTKKLTIKNPTKDQLQQLLFITTKGNKKLSEYISDIFINVPPEALEIFKYGRSHIETEEDFKIIETEEDYWVMQNGFPSNLFNDPLGTTYTEKGIYVLIYPGIFEGCPEYHKNFLEYIFNKFHDIYPDSTLLFIPLSINISNIQNIREKYPYVITVKYSSTNPYLVDNPLELKILLALTDTKNVISTIKSSKDVKKFKNRSKLNQFLFKCDVKINRYGIKFYNLYETNHYIHKFYYDKTKTEYHNLLKAIKDKMEEIQKQFNTNDAKSQYETYQLLYRNMIAYKLPYVQVGGKTQEIGSRLDLIEDAKGAATSALQHGIIKNPHIAFAALSLCYKQYMIITRTEELVAARIVSDIFNSLLAINLSMITENTITQNYINENIIPYLKKKASDSTLLSYIHDIPSDLPKIPYVNHKKPIYHLSSLYIELFNRIKEVIPKLLTTYNIIVPDTVVIDKQGGN